MIPLTLPVDALPVDPSAPEAQRWLIEELAKPEYQAARPSWFDIASKAVWDWLTSLTLPAGGGWDGLLLVFLALLIAGILTVVFLVYGKPHRGRRASPIGMIDPGDQRDARQLRRSAESAASRDDWTTAIVERFRALAVALDERTVVSVGPGTTAQTFATDARQAFPARGAALKTAADIFDGVRYGSRTGTREQYAEVSALDVTLASERTAEAVPV